MHAPPKLDVKVACGSRKKLLDFYGYTDQVMLVLGLGLGLGLWLTSHVILSRTVKLGEG